MWTALSATWVTCCAAIGAVIVPLLPNVVWKRESSGNCCPPTPPGTSRLRCTARHWPFGYDPRWRNVGTECLFPAMASLQWPLHDPLDLWHHRSRGNTFGFATPKRVIKYITAFLQSRWLRWSGHVQRATSCIKSVKVLMIPVPDGMECLENYCLNVRKLSQWMWPVWRWPPSQTRMRSQCLGLPTPSDTKMNIINYVECCKWCRSEEDLIVPDPTFSALLKKEFSCVKSRFIHLQAIWPSCVIIYNFYIVKENVNNINSYGSLAPKRRQAFIWANDGLVYWRIYALLGISELMFEGIFYYIDVFILCVYFGAKQIISHMMLTKTLSQQFYMIHRKSRLVSVIGHPHNTWPWYVAFIGRLWVVMAQICCSDINRPSNFKRLRYRIFAFL